MSESSSSVIGFLSLLTIVFIVLKLTEVIDWSWWWILLPMYGLFALFLGLVIMAGIAASIESIVKSFKNR